MSLEATHPFAGRHAALVLTESGAWENHLCKSGESIIAGDARSARAQRKWKVHRLRNDVHALTPHWDISNVQVDVCTACEVLQNIQFTALT